jgi:hypothetical protein
MGRFLSSVVIAFALATAGCGDNPNSPDSALPVTVSLTAGQSAQVGGLAVKFIGVSNDWRCPLDALCIQAGDAYLSFQFASGSRSGQTELQVNHPANKVGSFAGYVVEVQELMPYPSASNPIDPKTYKVMLRVSKD